MARMIDIAEAGMLTTDYEKEFIAKVVLQGSRRGMDRKFDEHRYQGSSVPLLP